MRIGKDSDHIIMRVEDAQAWNALHLFLPMVFRLLLTSYMNRGFVVQLAY
jgi:hypothetical protein